MNMRKIIFALTFVALWAVWYFGYPYFLMWLEGFSFFTTLPDFTVIHFNLPKDIFRYVGSFLLQFYAYPVVGAAVQALLPMLFVLCIDVVVRRVFSDSKGLLWVSYAFLPMYLYYQMSDMTLVRSMTILAIAAGVALLVYLVTAFVKPVLKVPAFLRNKYVSLVLLLVIAGASVGVLARYGSVGRYYKDALASLGIPCTTGGGNDLLQAQEIAVLRAILQVISNPRQDIPRFKRLPRWHERARQRAV